MILKKVILKKGSLLISSLLIVFLFQSSNIIPSSAAEYHYLYGCTKYVPGFNCDPITNEFKSSTINAEYIKEFSPTREPTFVDSVKGKALVLTANALESLSVNNNEGFNSQKFSIYLNVIPQNTENSQGSLVSFTGDPHIAGWNVDLFPTDNPSKKKIRFTVFNTEGFPFSAEDQNVNPDKLVEIIGTFDGEKVRLFLDGALKSETIFEGSYNNNPGSAIPIKFGGGAYCSCNTVSAVIDEIRYYNYALGSNSIGDIGSNQDSFKKDSLIGYWKFDGDIKDYSGLSNDAFYNTLIASMVFAPDGRLFYTEKNSGMIRVIQNDAISLKPFATISDVYVDWEEGLLSIALDGKFKDNHYLYIYYNYKDKNTDKIFSRVVRFTDIENEGKEPWVVLDNIPASKGFHTGGAMAFNQNDDKLYIFVGDGTIKENAQDTSLIYGKVLRVNRDGTIPEDNPFQGSPVFTYGHRNSYGLAFDNNGNGMLAESGPETYDEINLIHKGGNYGWPNLQIPNFPPESFTNNSSIKPIRSYFQPPSPTQAIFYDQDKYQKLQNTFVFGTVRGTLFSLEIDPDTKFLKEETKIDLHFYPYKPVVSIASSPNGELYFAGYEIYKIVSIDSENKKISMYPVEVNSTNVSVSQMRFYENDNKLELDLADEPGTSTLSIKVPKSMSQYKEELILTSKTTTANDDKTIIDLPHTIQVSTGNNYDIITLNLPEDYAKNDHLKFIIGESKIIVTKTVPEFEVSLVILTMAIGIVFIFSKNMSRFNSLNFKKIT
jgi:glucose/arabinose dehydrogenase